MSTLDPAAPAPNRTMRNVLIIIAIVAVLFIVVIVGFVLLVVFGVQGALKSSNVYKTSVSEAQGDPHVAALLGAPVVQDGMLGGSMNTENDSGTADMTIPLKGSTAKGTLHVQAVKNGGMWTFTHIGVTKENDDTEVALPNPAPVQ